MGKAGPRPIGSSCTRKTGSSEIEISPGPNLWHQVHASSDTQRFTPTACPTLQLAQGSLHTSDIPALAPGYGAMPGEIQKCLDEIRSSNPAWKQHYSSYNKRKSWTANCLQDLIPLTLDRSSPQR